MHMSGSPIVQVHPWALKVQSGRHPILAIPASKVSFPTLNPSPQNGLQDEGVVGFPPEQPHLGIGPEQSERHF